MKVVLASASPRRAQLFRQINLDFIVQPSTFDESNISEENPQKLVEYFSEQKGLDVCKSQKNCLVVAADTIVCLEGNILGKPDDNQSAKKMLRQLSGKTHQVYSGVFAAALSPLGIIDKSFTFSIRTNVTFSPLNDSEIERYVLSGSPLDKAGAYGIQDDAGSLFVKKIEGDYYNVVGFPLNAFYNKLKSDMPDLFKTMFLSTAAL